MLKHFIGGLHELAIQHRIFGVQWVAQWNLLAAKSLFKQPSMEEESLWMVRWTIITQIYKWQGISEAGLACEGTLPTNVGLERYRRTVGSYPDREGQRQRVRAKMREVLREDLRRLPAGSPATNQTAHIDADPPRERVEREAHAARVSRSQIQVRLRLVREPRGKALVIVDGRGAGRYVVDLEDSPVLAAGARGAGDHVAADDGLRSPRRDVIPGEEHLERVRQVHLPAGFGVSQIAERCERPVKEQRIGNAVRHAGVDERRHDLEVVIEAVVPVEGRVPGAEASVLVAGGRRASQRSVVIQYEDVPRCAEPHEEVADAIVDRHGVRENGPVEINGNARAYAEAPKVERQRRRGHSRL